VSDVNYATIHVFDFQRLVLAEYELKKLGWDYNKAIWAAPEGKGFCIKSNNLVAGAANTAESNPVYSLADYFKATRRANTVTDTNKRLDALDALVKQVFRADEVTRDTLDHRTEHLKNVGDYHTLEIEALKKSLERSYGLHDEQRVAVAKLSETVKSLRSKLEEAYTAIDKLTEKVDRNADSGNLNMAVDEKRYVEQQALNSALSKRVNALEDNAIKHALQSGSLMHGY